MVDVDTIGAGGGSIAFQDAGGVLFDVLDGFTNKEAAERDYGVVLKDAAGGSGFYRNRGPYKYEPRLLDLLLKTCIKAPGALLLPENIAISCFRWIYRPGQAH